MTHICIYIYHLLFPYESRRFENMNWGKRGMDMKGFICGFCILILFVVSNVSANMVLNVQHKFAGRRPPVSTLKEHDSRRYRHRRLQTVADLPLEGNGLANTTGLYYTQFELGTPANTYYVQVDTGSDVLWVNCYECIGCPTSTTLDVSLQLYNPQNSSTAQYVGCQNNQFCNAAQGVNANCASNSNCEFLMVYGDGSSATGYYVTDVMQYNDVTANYQTSTANVPISFGCATGRGGDLVSHQDALDGILGMGPANTSLVQQLASSGIAENTFAHCLAGAAGGGIFVIGEVVDPIVQTTPLLQTDQEHYSVNLESVAVGGTVLQIPASTFNSSNVETIIDSGTTLAYFVEAIYTPMMNAIMAQHTNLTNTSNCFQYSGSLDEGFPIVTFTFQNSLPMVVYPHEYINYQEESFPETGGEWCIMWQKSSSSSTGVNYNILGDLVLSSMLVVYDLENQTIGWTEYNCSDNIVVQGDPSAKTFLVNSSENATQAASSASPPFSSSSPDSSSAWSLDVERFTTFLLLTVVLHILIN